MTFAHAIWFDDISERLCQMDDPMFFKAWRHNLDRLVNEQENDVRRISLRDMTGFPVDDLDVADMCEAVMRDLIKRLRKHTGPNTTSLYQRGYHYFMDHVAKEKEFCQIMEPNESEEARDEYIWTKSGLGGITFTCAPLYDDESAKWLTMQDPYLTLADVASVCDADMMSFFKENLAGNRIGNVYANGNVIDWHLKARKMSVRQAFVQNSNPRSKNLKAMMDMYPQLRHGNRPRALTAMNTIFILADNSVVYGMNQLNNRFGWFPVIDPTVV